MKAIKDEDKSKNNFIIDGFPRNHDNKSGWERLMANKTNLQFVLYLDCSEQVNHHLLNGDKVFRFSLLYFDLYTTTHIV